MLHEGPTNHRWYVTAAIAEYPLTLTASLRLVITVLHICFILLVNELECYTSSLQVLTLSCADRNEHCSYN